MACRFGDDDTSTKDGEIDSDAKYDVGYAGGAYDLFHIGHLNLLKRAKERCNFLIAGVADDDEMERVKGRRPVVPLTERMEIIRHIDVVDKVVVQVRSDRIATHAEYPFDVYFKGSDWAGTPKGAALVDELAVIGVEVVFLPYTETTSSTHLRRLIEELIP